MVDDAYPEWRGRATPVSARRRLLSLSLSALDEDDCLGLLAAISLLFAHQNCAVAAALFSSAPLPRAASTTTASVPPPSSRER